MARPAGLEPTTPWFVARKSRARIISPLSTPALLGRNDLAELANGPSIRRLASTVEHECCEKLSENVRAVQREDVRDVLIRSDNDHAALLPIHAPHLEDGSPGRKVRAEHLFVVDQAEASLPGQQDCRHCVDVEVT